MKKLNIWLDNLVRRKGFKYVLVPELHKDGAIHFHGFVNSESLSLSDSGYFAKDKNIYNVLSFPFGFSTLIKIGSNFNERAKVSNYIRKYITKDIKSSIGGRFYLHGGKLNTPVFEYCNLSFDEFEGDTFNPYPNATAKIWRENF